jgi:galacturonosyltransferase
MHYEKDKVPILESWGCRFIETKVDRRGTNIFKDIKLFLFYLKLINTVKPDKVLTYTIQPNLYGGLSSRLCKIPYIANITGLGSGFKKDGLL